MPLSAKSSKFLDTAINAIVSAVLVGILAWAAGYGRMTKTIERLEKTQDEQLVPAVKEISSVSAHLSDINDKQLPWMQQKAEASEKTLNSLDGSVNVMRRKLNDEVIPWINRFKKDGPPIQSAQLEPLYEKQRQLAAEVARVQETGDKRAVSLQNQVAQAQESNGRHVAALQEEMETLSNTMWRVGESVFKPELEQIVKNAMKPIITEWEQTAAQQSHGLPIPAGQTFVPPGIALSTKPHVQVSLRDGVVSLVGVVPSEIAKTSILKTVESFYPKPRKVDADRLSVHP